MKLLIVNGPNLNMLGIREPEIYGKTTYPVLVEMLHIWAKELGIEIEVYQSNHEGDLLDKIQSVYGKVDGLIINAGAYTHTSIALLDCVKSVNIKAVEVHISDIYERESFRHVSYVAMACVKSFIGLGLIGYKKAMEYFLENN
jgi:3-dehydroquinate dehydratase-2